MKLVWLFFLAFAMTWGLAGCYQEGPNTPKSNNGKAAPEIGALYDQKCAICHGRDGKLMIGAAPDLTQSQLSLEERITLISYGKSTMPPQKGILSMEQIEALAKYVDKFK